MAAWVVNDAAENGNDTPGVVYVDLPDFPILSSLADELREQTYKELCPDCAYDKLAVGLADLQTAQRQDRVVPAVEPGHEVRDHLDRLGPSSDCRRRSRPPGSTT